MSVHRQMVCNDNIFVFNVNFVDTFRWAVRKATLIDNHCTQGSCQVTGRSILYLKGKYRIDVKEGGGGQLLTSI